MTISVQTVTTSSERATSPQRRAEASPEEDLRAIPAGGGLASPLLQLGLAFVFVYAAASTLLDPAAYRAYLPPALRLGATTDVMLRAFAVYELALAGALALPRFRRPASLLAALTLLAIVAVNGHAFEVLFRNVAIACAALALASMSGGSRRGHNVARAGDVAQVA